jgi:hypothetical protein
MRVVAADFSVIEPFEIRAGAVLLRQCAQEDVFSNEEWARDHEKHSNWIGAETKASRKVAEPQRQRKERQNNYWQNDLDSLCEFSASSRLCERTYSSN